MSDAPKPQCPLCRGIIVHRESIEPPEPPGKKTGRDRGRSRVTRRHGRGSRMRRTPSGSKG